MTLFSKRAQSERKKSFIADRQPAGFWADSCCRKLNLKYAQFLSLFEFFRRTFFRRSGHYGLALVRASAGIHVTWLGVDESLFAKFFQVFTQCRLQSLHVHGFLKARFNFVERRNTGALVFGHF